MRSIDALIPLRKTLGHHRHLGCMTRKWASWTTQFDHYARYWRGGDLDLIDPGAAMGLR